MTREQTIRWIWCFCHLAVAAFVQAGSHGSLSVTALSHLLLFDALGAFLCVVVDISRNFEVWNRSSISHPFGLERSEVLAGLAMSIILLFMGLDLLSHGLKHALENSGHTSHHVHPEGELGHITAGTINLAALAAILSTMVSASMLGNHARIGRAIRFPSFFPDSVRNPSHLLPVSLSFFLLILPLLGIEMSPLFDAVLGFGYAASMVVLGGRLCYAVGRMLLMSYSGSGIKEVLYDLETDAAVSAVEEAKVWQVHYGLCMANFKLRIRQMDQADRLRERVSSLVRNRLGGGYGQGSRGVKWEVSTQITLDA